MQKHETGGWFLLKGKLVQPFDGEADPSVNRPSWSHGFTHFRTEHGEVQFCGVNWFEKNAHAASAPVRRPLE